MEGGVRLFVSYDLLVQGRHTLDEASACIEHCLLVGHLGVVLSHES